MAGTLANRLKKISRLAAITDFFGLENWDYSKQRENFERLKSLLSQNSM
jgi:hypothetical protein